MPALSPPPGHLSDFNDSSDTLVLAVTIVSAVMIPVTSMVVLVRLYANITSARKLGWDDGKYSNFYYFDDP